MDDVGRDSRAASLSPPITHLIAYCARSIDPIEEIRSIDRRRSACTGYQSEKINISSLPSRAGARAASRESRRNKLTHRHTTSPVGKGARGLRDYKMTNVPRARTDIYVQLNSRGSLFIRAARLAHRFAPR